MENFNWLKARFKPTNEFIKVRQYKSFTPLFIDENWKFHDIEELDFTSNPIDNDNNESDKYDLNDYRAIYG